MVAIFPNVCLWRRSLCSNLAGIDPDKLYRGTFICQYGRCCGIVWPSFLFDSFLKTWANGLPPPPPWPKIAENKHQLRTGLVKYMILKLHGNETGSSCDQRLLFSLGASLLVDAASPRTISIDKKQKSSGTQGIKLPDLHVKRVQKWTSLTCVAITS